MQKIINFLSRGVLSAAMALTCLPSVAGQSSPAFAGLWKYTGLTASSGEDMPLSGIFLFADGKFLQQAVFEGEPYARQRSMAHSGTFTPDEAGVDLRAGQTLSLLPGDDEALSNAGVTEHDLAVTLEGDALTLVFGSGTVQTLERVGQAEDARVYPLAKGMLAFADEYFILIAGDGDAAVTGYGTWREEDEQLWLEVIRWSEGANGVAQNLRDVTLSARFDGSELVLADGRRFPVTP